MKKLVFLIIAILCISCSNISDNKIEEAKQFCSKNNYNTEYCIFVDFSSFSGSKRLVLYNLKENKSVFSCKCAHGNDGSEKMEATEQSFGNEIGSHKSSLGKYRIGKKRKINSVDGMFDVSMFNIPCYEMHGLEKTNSNAYKRGILIHPDPTMNSLPLPLLPWHSFGCFSVSNSSFEILSEYISKSKRPMLLWAYYK